MLQSLVTFLPAVLVLLVVLVAVGKGTTNLWWGVLVDERNKLSLSRLQLVLWTWLLLATLTAVAAKYGTSHIVLPGEIWALMGISIGSSTAAVIVKDIKSGAANPSTALAGEATDVVKGKLARNPAGSDWKFSDIFRGETPSNAQTIDIAKLQMALITAVVWLAYVWTILKWTLPETVPSDKGISLPLLDQGTVILIGLSHSGYITAKSMRT